MLCATYRQRCCHCELVYIQEGGVTTPREEVACNYLSNHSRKQMRKDARDIGPLPITITSGPTALSNSRCLVEVQRQITTHNTYETEHRQEQ